MDKITLKATSDYSTAGRQWIGRVLGPDPKWGLALDFCGRRVGRRGDLTEVDVFSPGIYKLRSTTRKGHDETYVLIWQDGVDLWSTPITELYARDLARAGACHSDAALNAAGREHEIKGHESRLAKYDDRLDEVADVRIFCARRLGLDHDGTHTYRQIREARERRIAHLRGEAPPTPGPRAALQAERATLVARLAEIDALLAS